MIQFLMNYLKIMIKNHLNINYIHIGLDKKLNKFINYLNHLKIIK